MNKYFDGFSRSLICFFRVYFHTQFNISKLRLLIMRNTFYSDTFHDTCQIFIKMSVLIMHHGLSQQGVWVPFWTPKPLKRTPQDTQIFLCGISKNLNLKLIIDFSPLLIIPMTLFNEIMPYVDELIHVYGWNMGILWYPLKIWTPKNFTTANFRHPVSKSWLRHCHA